MVANARNRIVLDGGDSRRLEEYTLTGVAKPGHLLAVNSSGLALKHAVSGARTLLRIAMEDSLQGNTIDTAYASGDLVPVFIPVPGDRFLGRLPIGQNITKGTRLMSAGDGTLMGVSDAGQEGGKLYVNTAASTVLTSFTTITAFDKSYTIPANFLQVGDVIRIRAQCFCVATNSTDTLVFTLKIGSTTIIATAAVDVANSDVGYITADLVVRSIGASGTFVGTGVQSLGVPGTATAKPYALASTTIDTTATQLITANATMSVSNSGNQIRLDILDISLARAGGLSALCEAVESIDNSAGSAEAFIACRAA